MNHLRMTARQKDGSYELLDPDQLREAVQRLGQAEDALESQCNQGRGTDLQFLTGCWPKS